MPDGTVRSKRAPTFNTLAREKSFKHPSKTGSVAPILNEFVAPHIESFNALFDDSGLHSGDGDGRGLLSLAIQDIGERVVFDGNGLVGSESGPGSWGNRMRSEHAAYVRRASLTLPINSMDRPSLHSSANGIGKGQNR